MNDPYLSEQIITYIGNKRALLSFIETALVSVKEKSGRDRLDIADVFSGSGIVSRFFKAHAAKLYTNDLEDYCNTINRCYLANASSVDMDELTAHYRKVNQRLDDGPLVKGFISEMYAPADDDDIQPGERVFYTARNAAYIDTARMLIEEIPEPYKTFLLAPLLYEASVHTNTSGVFKGYYKNSETGVGRFGGDGQNALSRIMADIDLKMPVFGKHECEVEIFKEDANELAAKLGNLDLAYLDPPYNQHPYGSNYFMLNLIDSYKRPENVSVVSGIPKDWNRSDYNKKLTAKDKMFDLCSKLDSRFLLISFNSEGFIEKDEMTDMLGRVGEVSVFDRQYNTFRASRNLGSRNIHVREYLYLVEKK